MAALTAAFSVAHDAEAGTGAGAGTVDETFLVPIIVANLTNTGVTVRITRVQCKEDGEGDVVPDCWRDEAEWKIMVGSCEADGDMKIDLDPHETRRYSVKLCGHCKIVHAVNHRVYLVSTCESLDFQITAREVTAGGADGEGTGMEVTLSGTQRGVAKPAVIAQPEVVDAPPVDPSAIAAAAAAAAAASASATAHDGAAAPASEVSEASGASEAPPLAEVEATPAGRRVFSWWCSGSKPLQFWLNLAHLDGAGALDAKAPSAGGAFLFTHQCDYGMLKWYPDGAYSAEAQTGAWIRGGEDVLSFGC